MAQNDIIVAKEGSGGVLAEIALAPADIGAVASNDARLTDARTPTAHASTHHTGGTDAIAPNNISAQWELVVSGPFITGDTVLSAGRNRRITLSVVAAANVDLPYENNVNGDVVTLVQGATGALTATIRKADALSGGVPFAWSTLATLTTVGQSFTFVSNGTATGWALRSVDTHTHAAADVTTGTFDNDRINFAAPAAIGNTTPNTLAGTQLALHDGSDTGTFVAASKLTDDRTYDLPDASGTLALLETLPAGGTKTYAVFTATDNQPPATAFATLDTRGTGIAVLDFDDATDESAVFVGILPEGASLGSGLKIRLHWASETQTSGDVRWDVSLERMTTDIDSDSFDTVASATATTSGTSGILTVTEITLTTIDSVTAGDGFRLKVTRDADNVADDMLDDAELVLCEVRSAA